MRSDERKRGIGSGIPEKSSAGGGKGPRASLEVAVALALDGFLDAQQHRGEPLIQPRDGVEFLHLAPAEKRGSGSGRGWERGVTDTGIKGREIGEKWEGAMQRRTVKGGKTRGKGGRNKGKGGKNKVEKGKRGKRGEEKKRKAGKGKNQGETGGKIQGESGEKQGKGEK